MLSIYFGSDIAYADWIRDTINQEVVVCSNFLQINNILSESIRKRKEDHCFVFIQRKNKLSDLKTISHLTKSYSSVYNNVPNPKSPASAVPRSPYPSGRSFSAKACEYGAFIPFTLA